MHGALCVFTFHRGQQRFGPFVTMIYKMIAGDLFRFGIIYIIFLIGFTQGLLSLRKKKLDKDTHHKIAFLVAQTTE